MQQRREAVAQQRRAIDRISTLRLATGGVAAILAIAAWQDVLAGTWLLLPLSVFVALVIAHERVHRAHERASRAVRHYRAGLRRLDDRWAGHGHAGEELLPAEHPYASDLDLFGRGSLFELLCTARTASGRRTLAAWLLAPAARDEVLARQAAVRELTSRVDLREALALAGDELDVGLDPAELSRWGRAPARLPAARMRSHRALAFGVPALSALAGLSWWWAGPWPVIVMLALTWIVGRLTDRFVRGAQVAAERSARQLAVLARVLAVLEHERWSDPMLSRLRTTLASGRGSASRQIRALSRMLAWAEASRSQIFAPVAFVLLWDLHFALALERWRLREGPAIDGWLDALGQLEALASLSSHCFEHPDDPFPELVDGPPVLEGQDVGHPLLPATQCVRNPISLGPDVRARIVSGSNMSGKSTYLRTVGTNVVLALAGAPVRARSLRLSVLRVGATLRVQDSLQGGASRFFAEITRLRAVVALAEQGPGVLFLLDEILHGTNSHDRRIGGHAIIEGLLDRGALGLVTTHDLALAAATEDPRVVNVHFCDELVGGTLRFDYRLRPGVVRTSNALALMEAVGLPVPVMAPAATPTDEQTQ